MLRKALQVPLIGVVGILAPLASSTHAQDDSSALYSVDLSSGQSQEIGSIGDGYAVSGLALLSDGSTAVAISGGSDLVFFDRYNPASVSGVLEVSGIGGDTLVGIDVRPATGEIWAVSSSSILYVIDLGSGQASTPGGVFDPALESGSSGFDFNPTVDRIRADVATGQNLRLNPNTGLVGTNPDTGAPTIDGRLTYASGDTNAGVSPSVVGAGYTNSVAGATATTLYTIDTNTGSLAIQNPPNDGVLNTVGALGIFIQGDSGFDIAPSGEAFLTADEGGRLRTSPQGDDDDGNDDGDDGSSNIGVNLTNPDDNDDVDNNDDSVDNTNDDNGNSNDDEEEDQSENEGNPLGGSDDD